MAECISDNEKQSPKQDGWPEEFWRAFEGMPEGFDRPDQIPQRREVDFNSSPDCTIKPS